MKAVFAITLLCLLVAVAHAATPARPKLPESFSALIAIDAVRHDSGGVVRGEGVWNSDQPNGMGRQLWQFRPPSRIRDLVVVERYDQGRIYELFPEAQDCNIKDVVGSMPRVWGWVDLAGYIGQRSFPDGTKCDLWSEEEFGRKLTLCVDDSNPNVPVALTIQRDAQDYEVVTFRTFHAEAPPSNDFDVPKACTSSIKIAAPIKATPARPKLPEVFSSLIHVDAVRPNHMGPVRGSGIWNVNQPTGMSRTLWQFQGPSPVRDLEIVERYDMGRIFTWFPENQDCNIKDIVGTMPRTWGWVDIAGYIGQRSFPDGTKCDLWQEEEFGRKFTLCVDDANPNVPLVLTIQRESQDYDVISFRTFHAVAPPSNDFDEPEGCKSPSPSSFYTKPARKHNSGFSKVTVTHTN